MAHFESEIKRLTTGQNEYFEELTRITGFNNNLNFSAYAKVNLQPDPNFNQENITIEYTRNFVGFLLSKERRQSDVDVNQMINGLSSIGHLLRNSEKSIILDTQRALLRTHPRLTARNAYYLILPIFIKCMPPNDDHLKELIRLLEDQQSKLDYKPAYEHRTISNEEWIRFILVLSAS